MSRAKKIYQRYLLWPFGLAVAIPVLMLAGGCSQGSGKPAQPGEQGPAKAVKVARAERGPAPETVTATGTLAAQDRAVLSVKALGRVESILVDLGSQVRAGQVLAQIERIDFELRRAQAAAALAQVQGRIGIPPGSTNDDVKPENASNVKEARAVLNEATRNRERVLQLKEQGIIAQADVETAEATFQVASNRYEGALNDARDRIALLKQRRAELNLAEQQLADTTIRAPFDGVVEQRQTSPGELLKEGTPVLTLVRIDPIRLRLQVPERDAPKLKVGQSVQLRLEGEAKVYEGKLSRLSPVISADNRMLVAEADIPNPEGTLRPGAFAKVDVVVNESREGLFVPNDSVVTFAGLQKVFSVEEGKAVEKEVTCGKARGKEIEILSGLKPGEMVVVEPGNLRSGQPVAVEDKRT